MESEEYPAEVILEAIDTMATSQQQSSPKRPKVILFDIGGVCVISPFQSILNYELRLGIPPGWVNYSISRTAPSGFWHRLETGSIPLDAAFFEGFNRDLHDPTRWEAFYRAQHQARHSSSSSSSTKDLTIPPVPQLDGEWLFNDMMTSATAPDPWMLPALKALRASGEYIVAALSNTIIFPPGHPLATWGGDQGTTTNTTTTSSSNSNSNSNSASSNSNSIDDFVSGDPLRQLFDVFISSAHVGLRKPDPRIYHLALSRVDAFARANADTERGRQAAAARSGSQQSGWKDGVQADEVVFLDDIGENLKAARAVGFGTIRVPLGRAYEAVEKLEGVTGLRLAGGHPKVPVRVDYGGGRSKM